jgi:hypothetical protein
MHFLTYYLGIKFCTVWVKFVFLTQPWQEEDEKALKKQYPTLTQFKEQIDFYEGLHEQLKHIKNIEVIQVSKTG